MYLTFDEGVRDISGNEVFVQNEKVEIKGGLAYLRPKFTLCSSSVNLTDPRSPQSPLFIKLCLLIYLG
jgi:hypothetical protein